MRASPDIVDSRIDQIETAVSVSGGRGNIPEWLCKNTRDPKNRQKNWTFLHHEYQIGILSDKAPHKAVRKCAQVGVSEISVRETLALLAKYSGETAIYTLPSSAFASKFATTRIDPVIKSSPRLSQEVSKTVNSTELKQIGSSFLYIGGAQKEAQAISVPARILVRDEISFCPPDILSVYQSRLGHNKPEDRIMIDFSTPLYPEMGIDEVYQQGTRFVYMVYHDVCGQWVYVDSLQDIVLPGFDDHLSTLDKRDLDNPRVRAKDAWAKCPQCSTAVSQANLVDPTKRAWVAHEPDRDIHSYHIDPLDAAAIKSPPQIISDLKLYKTTARWVQYGIGQPFESADSQIMDSVLDNSFAINRMPPGTAQISGAVAGMDTGKLSYLANGKKVDGVLDIFNLEVVKMGGDNERGKLFVDRFRGYNSIQGVMDAGPDLEVVKYVQQRVPYNKVWGCYFVRSPRKSSLELFEQKEEEGIVNARRTMVIDEFVKDFNGGRIRLPRGLPFQKEVRDHLKKFKRIVNEDLLGEEVAIWVSSKPDHWFLAIFYCWLAAYMVEESGQMVALSGGGSLVSKIRLKTGLPPNKL